MEYIPADPFSPLASRFREPSALGQNGACCPDVKETYAWHLTDISMRTYMFL